MMHTGVKFLKHCNPLMASRMSSNMMLRAAAMPLQRGTFCLMQSTPVRGFAYHQNVIDHYENPRNVGSFDKKDKDVGTGLVGAPACGDVMKL